MNEKYCISCGEQFYPTESNLTGWCSWDCQQDWWNMVDYEEAYYEDYGA